MLGAPEKVAYNFQTLEYLTLTSRRFNLKKSSVVKFAKENILVTYGEIVFLVNFAHTDVHVHWD